RWHFNGDRLKDLDDETQVVFADTGTYVAQFTLRNKSYPIQLFCNVYDTFTFTYDSIVQVLGADTIICNDTSITISTIENFDNYNWSNGSKDSSTTFYDSTEAVNIRVYRNGCTANDYMRLTFKKISYQNTLDTTICQNEQAKIYVHTPHNVKWQDETNEKSLAVKTEGIYHFTVYDDDCQTNDSIQVNYRSVKALPKFGLDTTVCNGDSLLFTINDTSGFKQYIGNRLYAEPSYLLPGEHYVVTYNGCDSLRSNIYVEAIPCHLNFFMPTAFTPSKPDGINDSVAPVFNDVVTDYQFYIFSRNGTRVFSSRDPSEKWTGYLNGKLLPVGSYTYVVKFTFTDAMGNKEEHVKQGNIALIR
ncbi:MAG: gliding motility-associated C-terminal domain-containing protein, partial [Bacteroidetes bacterium]|nr:gliding motility-associated C-terminal domain-containing protein [Bacteroidota bacterium]